MRRMQMIYVTEWQRQLADSVLTTVHPPRPAAVISERSLRSEESLFDLRGQERFLAARNDGI